MKKVPIPAVPIICLLLACACNAGKDNQSSDAVRITNQGVNIAYTDTGKGDTTLLFVHGWCINRSYWEEQVAAFRDQYRVVTVDLPGFGESGANRNNWTVEAYGQDIDTVMSKLNLQNVILIGHSMAGNIVVEAAALAPDRVIGLVGIDNFKGFRQPLDAATKEAIAKALAELKSNFSAVATEWCYQELFYKTTDTAIRKRVLDDILHGDTVIAAACLGDSSFNEVAKLAAAKRKLYMINSDVTPTDTSGFIKHGLPYEVLEIHATGHYPMIEKPAEFDSLLDKALNKIKLEARVSG